MPLKHYETSDEYEYTPPETEYDVCDINNIVANGDIFSKIINAAYQCGYEYIDHICRDRYSSDNISLIFRKIKEGR